MMIMPNSYPTILRSPLSLIFKIILGLALLSGLVACGGSDDPDTVTVTFTDAAVVEGDGDTDSYTTELIFSATISPATTEAVSIAYSTADGDFPAVESNAIEGDDYIASSGRLDIPAGSTSANITIMVKKDDVVESDEILTLNLSDATGVTLTTTSLMGTIVNDDHHDASGLFTGTGSVNNGTNLTDVRGFAHDNRFIFFDETEAVLYDGNITNITESDLTATVDVYKDGARVTPSSITVSGTVISQSSLSLILDDSGYAQGTLTLTFDTAYNEGATTEKLATPFLTRWIGDAHTPDTTDSGIVRLRTDDISEVTFTGDTSVTFCDYEGDRNIPDPSINIYLITSLEVTDPGGGLCDHIGAGYTGFITVFDGVDPDDRYDDTLLFAMTNGEFSNFSIMTLFSYQ